MLGVCTVQRFRGGLNGTPAKAEKFRWFIHTHTVVATMHRYFLITKLVC